MTLFFHRLRRAVRRLRRRFWRAIDLAILHDADSRTFLVEMGAAAATEEVLDHACWTAATRLKYGADSAPVREQVVAVHVALMEAITTALEQTE